jgi:exodeoxyribonuclease VII small subunit
MKFEDALKKLEETVTTLEAGELPLEQALGMFETGVNMSRLCMKKLEQAEQKVELLLNVSEDGKAQTTLFDTTALED